LLNKIDHIVYCCKKLESGINYISDLTGIEATYGGRHLTKGTHNAIFKISPHAYFEILAPDPANSNINPPRWMGIDLIEKSRITRWAIKTKNINAQSKALSNYKLEYGNVQKGSRALEDGSMLQWQLTDPLTNPAVEVVPFLLDWKDSVHPSTSLEQHCSITNITITHPESTAINDVLRQLELKLSYIKDSESTIIIELDTPKGIVTIE